MASSSNSVMACLASATKKLENKTQTQFYVSRRVKTTIQESSIELQIINRRSDFGNKKSTQYGDVKLERLLKTALRHTIYWCHYGAINRIEGIRKTNGWVQSIHLRNADKSEFKKAASNKWISQNSQKSYAVMFKTYISSRNSSSLTSEMKSVLINTIEYHKLILFSVISKQIYETREAQCFRRSCFLVNYLWEHNNGISKIEIVRTDTFDHCFVIVNREGDLHDSSTWGDNCWCLDPWFENEGIVYHASTFKEVINRVKDFARLQKEELIKIGVHTSEILDKEEKLADEFVFIDPKKFPYFPLIDYLVIENFPNDIRDIESLKRLHADKMKPCLNEIEKLKTMKCK